MQALITFADGLHRCVGETTRSVRLHDEPTWQGHTYLACICDIAQTREYNPLPYRKSVFLNHDLMIHSVGLDKGWAGWVNKISGLQPLELREQSQSQISHATHGMYMST